MKITKYMSISYPKVLPFDGVNSIEERIVNEKYLVVIDNDDFVGILTPLDLIRRPHKIVIDCLTEKDKIYENETLLTIIDKFDKNGSPALPVFQGDKFIGIVEKENLIGELKIKISDLYDRSIISQNIKQSFLQNISHEIRTPLNAILGFMDIISNMDTEDFRRKGKKYFSIVKKSADKFLLIMNDLMNLALINSGDHIEIEKKNIHVENIFSDLKYYFETVTDLLSDKEIVISYVNPDSSLIVYSDEDKIKHILYHLLDNAIKFSNYDKVNFGCRLEETNIVFFVTNNGIQIPEEDRDRIFEIFEKGDVENKVCISGMGIGLPLVKKMSELLGGKIDFLSDETKTTFYCTLPFEEVEAEEIELVSG